MLPAETLKERKTTTGVESKVLTFKKKGKFMLSFFLLLGLLPENENISHIRQF